jgi:hypothetical protein
MICDICRSTCIIDSTRPEVTHHQTCSAFKRSVDLGCYFCNRLWAALRPIEREAVLVSAESESNIGNDNAGTLACNKPYTSEADCISALSFGEGSAHGHPGCHVLQFTFKVSAVLPFEEMAGNRTWRASFLLRPFVGTSDPISGLLFGVHLIGNIRCTLDQAFSIRYTAFL